MKTEIEGLRTTVLTTLDELIIALEFTESSQDGQDSQGLVNLRNALELAKELRQEIISSADNSREFWGQVETCVHFVATAIKIVIEIYSLLNYHQYRIYQNENRFNYKIIKNSGFNFTRRVRPESGSDKVISISSRKWEERTRDISTPIHLRRVKYSATLASCA